MPTNLPCTYLAHHELASVIIMITIYYMSFAIPNQWATINHMLQGRFGLLVKLHALIELIPARDSSSH